MDLRDRFAVHLAAALVGAFPEPEQIARRAYDLAEAMLAERARRVDRDEQAALVQEGNAAFALLDEVIPMIDEDELDLEPPYDPSWDLDERRFAASPSRPPGPGLARTAPAAETEERQERSA